MKCAVIMLVLAACAAAQEPKKEVAAIAALEPAALVTGGTATMKIRGFKLKDATEIRFPKAPGVKAVVKEKKDAGQVNGLDNKATGDTQIVAEFTLPADLPAGPLEFTIATPAGDAAAKIPVVAASEAVEEKEPNNGFRETQKLALGQSIVGSINGERDVDVYEITVKAGQKIRATVTGGSAVTMDAALTCYDARGQFLASCDDAETRDPVLSLTAPADGPLLLCISDAHDKGGEWHSYLFTVEEAK
ncbi:MAG: pre-peptidase C-terminal domain-containing protein [Verrucomicrobia bacterium]|nr:MAG: pre-peptidase C-terminal domain-containing protein [Verrucomicrobiota bacterium]